MWFIIFLVYQTAPYRAQAKNNNSDTPLYEKERKL